MIIQQPNLTPQRSTNRPLINARAVAWALSGAAVCCLAAGMLALNSLEGSGGARPLENEPEQLTTTPQTPAERPTVLPSMSVLPEQSLDGVRTYDRLFPADAPNAPAQPAPRPSTALTSDSETRR